jgi:hypothetical protein
MALLPPSLSDSLINKDHSTAALTTFSSISLYAPDHSVRLLSHRQLLHLPSLSSWLNAAGLATLFQFQISPKPHNPETPNKTDAGSSSYGNCRIINTRHGLI